jgi:hypothetical protein
MTSLQASLIMTLAEEDSAREGEGEVLSMEALAWMMLLTLKPRRWLPTKMVQQIGAKQTGRTWNAWSRQMARTLTLRTLTLTGVQAPLTRCVEAAWAVTGKRNVVGGEPARMGPAIQEPRTGVKMKEAKGA